MPTFFAVPSPPEGFPEALAQQPPLKSKAGEYIVSLGEEFAPPSAPSLAIKSENLPKRSDGPSVARTASGYAPSSASTSNPSQALPLPQVAAQLATVTTEKIDAAWSNVKSELGVQKLVWESLQLSKSKQLQDKIATLRKLLQDSLDAWQQTNAARARQLLDEALRLGEEGRDVVCASTGHMGGLMSTSMAVACRAVEKESTTPAIERRKELLKKLQAANTVSLGQEVVPPSARRSEADKKEIEELIVACQIGDAQIERAVRIILNIQIPGDIDHFGEPVTGKKRSSSVGSTTSKGSNSKLGSAAKGSTKRLSRSHSSGSLGAPVGPQRTPSLMEILLRAAKPTVADSSDFGRAVGEATLSDLPPSDKASKAALKVRTMATDQHEAAWKALSEELKVQKMVWSSLVSQQKVDSSRTSLAKSMIKEAMATRAESSIAALGTLEKLLKDEKGTETLSKAMIKVLRNVLEQAGLFVERSMLAERLAVSNIAATHPRDPAGKKELETIVVRSKLQNAKLEVTVRKLLLLLLPEDLSTVASPARSKRTQSPAAITASPKNLMNMSPVDAKAHSAIDPGVVVKKKKPVLRRAQSSSAVEKQRSPGQTQEKLQRMASQGAFDFDPSTRVARF